MLRNAEWLVISAALTVAVGILYPAQLGVLLWTLLKLSAAGYLGYWLDRTLFPYARPHRAPTDGWRQIRRAIVIAGALIAMGISV
jgi:hypothetical protein